MSSRSQCCCGLSCMDLVALAIILGLGTVFYGNFDQGICGVVIAVVAILALC